MSSEQMQSRKPQSSRPASTQQTSNSEAQGIAFGAPPQNLVQRITADPHTMTTGDMLYLQRAIGNRAVQRLVNRERARSDATAPPLRVGNGSIQRAMTVGAANDKFEDEAEAIANGIQRALLDKPTAAPNPKDDDGVSTIETVPSISRVQRTTAVGPEGGSVDNNIESRIRQSQSSGSSMPNHVRESLEPKLGADLKPVKVHTDSASEQLNRELGAKAFTHKNHIYYGAGQSPSDMKLTTHEAVHTIQQGAVKQAPIQPKRIQRKRDERAEDANPADSPHIIEQASTPNQIARQHQGDGVIQRAVGFEFEDPTWTVFKLQPGRTFRDPDSVKWYNPMSWSMGKVAQPGSEKTDEEEKEAQYTGKNIWHTEENADQHINKKVGQFNLQTGPKKGTLHQGVDYKIEPDGPYTEDGVTNRMDLEIVTEPFPETPQGRERLVRSLDDLTQVFNRLPARGKWNPKTDLEYSKFVTPTQNAFSDGSVYLYGGKPGGAFKPQVTSGVDLASLPQVMETLGRPSTESTMIEGEKHAPIREMVYGTSDSSRLGGDATISAVGNASVYAQTVINNLHKDRIIGKGETGVDKLKGFLALAILNMTVLSTPIKEGIKNVMPLLSRYSMATLFSQIPETVREKIRGEDGRIALVARMDEVIKASVFRYLNSKYPNAESYARRIANQGMAGPMMQPRLKETVNNVEQDADTLITGLTFSRQEWLLNILAGSDLLSPGDLLKYLKREDSSVTQKEAARDYDKSIAVFLRGYGNTTNVKDVVGEEKGGLALFENRNVNPWQGVKDKAAGINIGEVRTLALQYFDWLVSVKQANEQQMQVKETQKERMTKDSQTARSTNFWG